VRVADADTVRLGVEFAVGDGMLLTERLGPVAVALPEGFVVCALRVAGAVCVPVNADKVDRPLPVAVRECSDNERSPISLLVMVDTTLRGEPDDEGVVDTLEVRCGPEAVRDLVAEGVATCVGVNTSVCVKAADVLGL
jgi:hypothetical protein